MWLFTRYGFYSIACASKPDGSLDTQTVMIRARMQEHLRNLQQRFPSLASLEILELPDRDYRYRLIAPKAVWTDIVSELAKEQTWSNFKNEVALFQRGADPSYVDALHDVWEVMYRVQKS